MQAKPGPMPTLTASAPAAARSRTPSAVATLPAITSACGKRRFSSRTASSAAVRVAVGDVEHERVGLGGEQRLGALEVAAAHADRRGHAQPALGVARRLRIARLLLEVAQRDHAGDAPVGVGQRQLLDAVLVQQRERLGRARCPAAR